MAKFFNKSKKLGAPFPQIWTKINFAEEKDFVSFLQKIRKN